MNPRSPVGRCPVDAAADARADRAPVRLDEIAPWYAAGAAFTVLGLLAGGVSSLAALGTGAGVLVVGAAVWLVISRNS